MAKITFLTSDGGRTTLEATSGTLMELARDHSIKGIDADCGGVCSCATCHVHLEPAYFEKISPATEIENDMLEFEDNATVYSRLSCQVKISEALDGATVEVAN